jgi:hypothetical protein
MASRWAAIQEEADVAKEQPAPYDHEAKTGGHRYLLSEHAQNRLFLIEQGKVDLETEVQRALAGEFDCDKPEQDHGFLVVHIPSEEQGGY